MRLEGVSVFYPREKNRDVAFCGKIKIWWGDLPGVSCPVCGGDFLFRSQIWRWHKYAKEAKGGALRGLIEDVFGAQADSLPAKRVLIQIGDTADNKKRPLGLYEAFIQLCKTTFSKRSLNKMSADVDRCINNLSQDEIYTDDMVRLIKELRIFLSEQRDRIDGSNIKSLASCTTFNKKLFARFQNWCPQKSIEDLYSHVSDSRESLDLLEEWRILQSIQSEQQLIKLINMFKTSSDHIRAAVRGGKNDIINFIPMHSQCNAIKGDARWGVLIGAAVTNARRIMNCIDAMKDGANWKAMGLSYERWRSCVRRALIDEGVDFRGQ